MKTTELLHRVEELMDIGYRVNLNVGKSLRADVSYQLRFIKGLRSHSITAGTGHSHTISELIFFCDRLIELNGVPRS